MIIRAVAIATALAVSPPASAADFPPSPPGGHAPALRGETGITAYGGILGPWFRGGRHWRGHYDMSWRAREPKFIYAAPAWGVGWSYAPRGAYELPDPAAPEAWSPDWYVYCATRYGSFDAATGTYLSESGLRRMCR